MLDVCKLEPFAAGVRPSSDPDAVITALKQKRDLRSIVCAPSDPGAMSKPFERGRLRSSQSG